jgi:glycosidase
MSPAGYRQSMLVAGALALTACVGTPMTPYYGTTEPFASEAVYFVMTDRFVDGDRSNNHPEQGGANRTFDRPLVGANGVPDNIGYLGGDFRGLLSHADYIRDMGFTAVWITPIVDNPDEAFTGGNRIGEGFFADRGKTGFHGY